MGNGVSFDWSHFTVLMLKHCKSSVHVWKYGTILIDLEMYFSGKVFTRELESDGRATTLFTLTFEMKSKILVYMDSVDVFIYSFMVETKL